MNKNILILGGIILFTTGCINPSNNFKAEPQSAVNQSQITAGQGLSCGDILKEAEKVIESMNYCQIDSDCQIVDDYPFACFYLANKEADKKGVNDLVAMYNFQACPEQIFDCVSVGLSASCYNQKCVING